jgi:hypothetical protein
VSAPPLVRLELVRSGGIAGLTRRWVVDVERLAPDERRGWEALVRAARLDAGPGAERGRGADRFVYRLMVERDGRREQHELAEETLSGGARALVERVVADG